MVKEEPRFELQDGKIFGEKALDNDKPRAATVFVKSKQMLACTLIKADYVRVMGSSYKQNEDMQVSVLKSFACLGKITENAIKTLYKSFREVNCGKDFVVSE
jgi:CRP-like cAMP-binding protein